LRNKTLIGITLANFQIQRLVAHGGMADVYHGVDTKLRRQVAIKVYDRESHSKSAQVSRFLQEARMMANWRHENIIQIFYAGDEIGLFYYVMEYVDGYDLASIMSVYEEKGELMPIDDVLRIGDAIASALDYAHKQGVIHRDVKPANVLVANGDGRVVLGDFGLALDLNEKSRGEVFGSPHYIAPEQARRSSDAVPQSDLYSLGIILYEMITGATPFNDPAPASLALQHITEPPPLPRSINPSVSVQVEEVLLKALEKSPKERYQSGESLMAALRKALNANPAKSQSDDSALPPIPVNAPTIQRSGVSLNSFTKRKDVITALEKRTSTHYPSDAEERSPVIQTGGRRLGWLLLLFLLLLTSWGFIIYRPGLFGQWFTTLQTAPTKTSIQILPVVQTPVASTSTILPESTASLISIAQTATKVLSPTVTITATQPTHTPEIPTTTSTLIPTVMTSTITLTPTGYLMTAYYNDNSFYILNKGGASRSVSGFAFERIDKNSVIQQRFEGWKWEKYFDTIQPNRCLSLEIHDSPDQYLRPPECRNKVLSPLVLLPDSGEKFWFANESNGLFRILWLGNEIARCKVEAGACDFYVP
jgi:serine/threonine protein kinase